MKNSRIPSPFEYSGIPLGGLGTGSVELRADGRFHAWQIMNNLPWGRGPASFEMEFEGFFFGLVASDGKRTRELMLGAPRWDDIDAFGKTDWIRWSVDPYHMPWMEFPRDIAYDGRFPFADLSYDTPGFPVRVTLEAWSPFIPLDAKDSGLPTAFLTFTLKNASRQKQRVSLFGALKNCVGYDFPDNKSVIKHSKAGKADALLFSREKLPRGTQSDGSMALGVWSRKEGKVTYVLHAAHPRDIYDPLMETGYLENLDRSSFAGGVGNNMGGGQRAARAAYGLSRGVLAKTVNLKPGEEVEITFALSWYFPNFAQKKCKGDEMEIAGHMYSNWFSSAEEVLSHAQKNMADLRSRSREFVDAYYSTTTDRWLLDAIAAQLTSFSKATWWDKQGRFAVWEGLGCCGLQTLDITLYGSWPIVLFFPELQKNQMEGVSVTYGTTGRPPHSYAMSFSECCFRPNNRIDNDVQFVLLVWRDAVWTGDTQYVKRMWPAIEAFMKDVEATDADGDGLPNNNGVDQTYDQFPLYGTSAYVGMQYVAAVKAVAEMAEMIGNHERAEELHARAEKGLATLEKELWNGEYYDLSYDGARDEGNPGCMADQVNADWFVRQTTADGLIADSRMKKALRAVWKYCWRKDYGYMANCDWPRGGRVKIRRLTSDQANCPWSGVEFGVAAHLFLAGMTREGTALMRGIWERYEHLGMRYNHIECGEHYYRAMCSWAVYLALSGFAWDSSAAQLTLSMPKENAQFVWNTPQSWGTVSFKGTKTVSIEAAAGKVGLKTLRLRGVSADTVKVRVNGRSVKAEAASRRGETVVTVARTVKLRRGGKMVVSF